MKNFIGIIPARYASTRFPGKPLAIIGGKTMIQRVYEQASKVLTQVIVATDDQRIFEAVKEFGGEVVFTSEKHNTGTERCAEAAKLVLNFQPTASPVYDDIIINIQGDEPFIKPQQIELLMKCFDDYNTSIATLIKPIASNNEVFNPNNVKAIIDNAGRAIYFSRTPIPYLRGVSTDQWEHKHQYYKHIGIYAYRKHILSEIIKLPPSSLEIAESLEQNRWIENGYIIQTKITEIESMAVDTPEDLEAIISTYSATDYDSIK